MFFAGAAAAVALMAGAGAQAYTIDTFGAWDGTSTIGSFGGGFTGVYGETFIAPERHLTSFTFVVNDFSSPIDHVTAQVYAWSGSLHGGQGPQGAVGPALFTSSPFSIAGITAYQKITVDTGLLPLTSGSAYVILLADTDNSDNQAGWADTFTHPGPPADGGFAFYNNDHTLGSINNSNWDDFADFGSLAYSATFVPEPATWAMMMVGMFGLGVLQRGRRRTVTA
jgi:hypothetical protein